MLPEKDFNEVEMQNLQKKCVIILCNVALFQTIAMANPPIRNMLFIGSAPMTVATTPIFSIGTTHGPTDSINSVTVTACNFDATSWFDCFNADNNGSEASTGSLSIKTGDTILISIPAIAQPLNFWQNVYPYNTPYTAVRISNSQGASCDSHVVAYNCTSSTTCPGLSFTPVVTCNFP
jgi:hypothetical protein